MMNRWKNHFCSYWMYMLVMTLLRMKHIQQSHYCPSMVP